MRLVFILILLGGGAIIFTVFCLFCDFVWARFGALVINAIRSDLFARIQTLSMNFFSQQLEGDILNRFLEDASTVEYALVVAIPSGLLGIFNILISGSFLFFIDWQLAVLSCVGLTVCLLAPRWFLPLAIQEGYKLRQQSGRLASVIQENISSQSVVKLFNLEKRMNEKFSGDLDDWLRVAVRANFLAYLVQRLPSLFFVLLHLLILAIGAAMSYAELISVGKLVSYQVLFIGLNSSISSLAWVIPSLLNGVAGMQRINHLLSENPQVQDIPDAIVLPHFCARICFDNVTFSYSQKREGVKNLCLTINKGEFAVFVGPSGAGKSTILNLLARFYDPDRGRILFDGVDLRYVTVRSLRSQIGLVSQNVILFNCSLRENIRMGYLEATDEQIEAAAKAAEIHDFIISLPQGYDTLAGERGGHLSGGQKQRIALARALVRDPAILILDEATSSLDSISEAGILATIEQLAKDRTVIAITHRLTQAVRADVIFVIDNGQLVAAGRHSDLIKQGGLYAALWQQSLRNNNNSRKNATD